jgi:hypothetical protein
VFVNIAHLLTPNSQQRMYLRPLRNRHTISSTDPPSSSQRCGRFPSAAN